MIGAKEAYLFNGKTYRAEDAGNMQIGEGDIVPIEAGYDFYAQAVIRWWENGEKIVFALAVG